MFSKSQYRAEIRFPEPDGTDHPQKLNYPTVLDGISLLSVFTRVSGTKRVDTILTSCRPTTASLGTSQTCLYQRYFVSAAVYRWLSGTIGSSANSKTGSTSLTENEQRSDPHRWNLQEEV
jgi:hypothetical protein